VTHTSDVETRPIVHTGDTGAVVGGGGWGEEREECEKKTRINRKRSEGG